jgi:hypothetical protein
MGISSLTNASVNAFYEEMLIVPEDHRKRAQESGNSANSLLESGLLGIESGKILRANSLSRTQLG